MRGLFIIYTWTCKEFVLVHLW